MSAHSQPPYSYRSRSDSSRNGHRISRSPMLPPGYSHGARKQACELCRQRKRRCDGGMPACSTCRKAQSRCVYALSSTNGNDSTVNDANLGVEYRGPYGSEDYMDTTTTGMPSSAFSWDPYRDASALSLPAATPSSSKSMPTAHEHSFMSDNATLEWLDSNINMDFVGQDSWDWNFQDPATLPPSGTVSDVDGSSDDWRKQSGSTRTGSSSKFDPNDLPSQQQAIELANIFFSSQHKLMPCIHRGTFMAKLHEDIRHVSSSPLLWVIIALACSCDKSAETQAQYEKWMRRAVIMLDDMTSSPVSSQCTSMLQASVWIVFESYTRGNLTPAWLLLGRMCQLASALGFNRVDCERPPKHLLDRLRGCTDIELEERRKSMWCLFLLDRMIGSINDLPLSLEEQQFKVNFPLADGIFQQSDISALACPREPFTVDAYDLLNSNATSAMITQPCFNHVLKASIILGRTMNTRNRLHNDDASDTKLLDEAQHLHTILQTFCAATSRSNRTSGTLTLIVTWLVQMLQYSRLLMLHPPAHENEGLCHCATEPSSRRSPECMQAVRIITTTFQRALDEESNMECLWNPFLLPVVCACVRVLSKENRRSNEVEQMQILFDTINRIQTKFPGATARCREAIERRLHAGDRSLPRGDVFFVNFDYS